MGTIWICQLFCGNWVLYILQEVDAKRKSTLGHVYTIDIRSWLLNDHDTVLSE